VPTAHSASLQGGGPRFKSLGFVEVPVRAPAPPPITAPIATPTGPPIKPIVAPVAAPPAAPPWVRSGSVLPHAASITAAPNTNVRPITGNPPIRARQNSIFVHDGSYYVSVGVCRAPGEFSLGRPIIKDVPESSAALISRSNSDSTSRTVVDPPSCSSRISPAHRFRDSRPKTRALSRLTASYPRRVQET
jgi:hypothetical protein